jgi:signal transduction histidine kinase
LPGHVAGTRRATPARVGDAVSYRVDGEMTDTTEEAQRLREELEAEREGRREAERIAAENARLLYERQDELELLEMVAEASNEAAEIEPALGAAIVYVCAHMRWPVGHAYLADQATGVLRPTGVWYLEDEARLAAFRHASEQSVSQALPAGVATAGEPAWVADVGSEPGFGRSEVATAAGLRSGFAFPILTGSRTVGVLEFFADRPAEPDPALLSVMGQIGVQLGRVIERVWARSELERSNADLEAFAYMASHDLAAPLRSVSGFVALLERQYGDELDDQAREFIGHAIAGVERMQAMIDDLLLFARAGTTALRPERMPARDVVAAVLRDLQPTVLERGATIEIGELPVVAADRGQLQRVFQNLLANAMKFTAPGVVPRVQVSGRTSDGASELAVADNGIGIEPEQAERVFDMFARVPGPAAEYRGTGLGLAISRRIVERHGGRLWVEPNAGGGSVFKLTLPLP